jgi:tRNA (adenine57-N1/adenine58-N1)-methyltransferase catalytic subunit
MPSPFLTPEAVTQDNQLAILHIRRDQSIPTILAAEPNPDLDTGYAEGVVTNTRFGSFPHSTLVAVPWGTQIRASLVDTGSRGRKQLRPPTGQKRKADELDEEDTHEGGLSFSGEGPSQKEAVAASSGFIHVLPPTPENWTTSLPHRTQVVYTPDYSYILHRIRARPGSVLIEAGSGSGSFTHAAARAVFSGYPEDGERGEPFSKKRKVGRVFSYEFHAERHGKVSEEMKQHGLDSIVTAVERDVYGSGFLVSEPGATQKTSPAANAIFLDLPAPWLALPHLTRTASVDNPSPLDPQSPVHICTFSPCIEQVQKTVSALRRHGWLDIDMVEMQQRRIDIRREYTGLEYEGMRGVNAIAADVDQALLRLKAVEQRARDYHTGQRENSRSEKGRLQQAGKPQEAQKTLFKDGRIVHRSEPELKTHTSYLVFAVLPREWTEEDEARARQKWALTTDSQPLKGAKSQRQLKREVKQKAKDWNRPPEVVDVASAASAAVEVGCSSDQLDMSIDDS